MLATTYSKAISPELMLSIVTIRIPESDCSLLRNDCVVESIAPTQSPCSLISNCGGGIQNLYMEEAQGGTIADYANPGFILRPRWETQSNPIRIEHRRYPTRDRPEGDDRKKYCHSDRHGSRDQIQRRCQKFFIKHNTRWRILNVCEFLYLSSSLFLYGCIPGFTG